MSAPLDVEWISTQTDDGRAGFRVGRRGDELFAEFAGIGLLRAARAGKPNEFTPVPGADPVIVDKVQSSLVPALLRHIDAKLTLHAAAVEVSEQAIVCFGESGAGKSTMAAWLCEHHGARLLGDDTTALELGTSGALAVPTEACHWLVSGSSVPDPHGALKSRVVPRARADKPCRVAAICRLGFDTTLEGPVLRPLEGQDALAALVPALIRFVVDEPEALLQELESLLLLKKHVRFFDLVRPPGTQYIDRSARALVELAMGERR